MSEYVDIPVSFVVSIALLLGFEFPSTGVCQQFDYRTISFGNPTAVAVFLGEVARDFVLYSRNIFRPSCCSAERMPKIVITNVCVTFVLVILSIPGLRNVCSLYFFFSSGLCQ